MSLLLFLISVSALAILLSPLLKRDRYKWWAIGFIFISGIIIAINGTYRSCRDGWASHSIGRQGACSWHGGVVTNLSDFGWGALIISLGIIIITYLYFSFLGKKEEKKKKLKQ